MSAGRVAHDLNALSVTCKSMAVTMVKGYKDPGTSRAKIIQLPLQAMLCCLSPRFTCTQLRAGLNEDDHQDLIKTIGDLTAEPDLHDYADIVSNKVFTHEDFPDVMQARLYFRMLASSSEAARQVEEAKRQGLKRKREDDEDE